jgi:hypothetical protein
MDEATKPNSERSLRSVLTPLRGYYGANPEEALTIWERLVKPKLGARAHAQFVRATTTNQNTFVERVLRPSLYVQNAAPWNVDTYYPVSIMAETPGRNHYLALRMAHPARGAFVSRDNPDCWAGLEFFANVLSVDEPDYEAGEHTWTGPRA